VGFWAGLIGFWSCIVFGVAVFYVFSGFGCVLGVVCHSAGGSIGFVVFCII